MTSNRSGARSNIRTCRNAATRLLLRSKTLLNRLLPSEQSCSVELRTYYVGVLSWRSDSTGCRRCAGHVNHPEQHHSGAEVQGLSLGIRQNLLRYFGTIEAY